jgi:hypothetical protein
LLSCTEKATVTGIKDDIAATEGDIADVKSTLADRTTIHNDHTRDRAVIKSDVTAYLDKTPPA